ncbi:hypothetical protein OG900_05850 [Streptomyces sp. NBC_00433]
MLSDAELLTLAVMSALLDYTSERRRLRRVDRDFRGMFPYVPRQSGYGKRLRAVSLLLTSMIRLLARDTSLWSDDVRLVGSTPPHPPVQHREVPPGRGGGPTGPGDQGRGRCERVGGGGGERGDGPPLRLAGPVREWPDDRAHPRFGRREAARRRL